MELGKRIAEIRKEHNLTQEGLAEICSVTRQTISNWENGKSYPDLETLVLISDTFGVSLDAMLKGDRKMVSEITKEQKQGRNSTIKMIAAVVIAIVIITGLFMVLENSFIKLKPTDYKVTVTEITLDDVTIDKNKKLATYMDPDMEDVSTDNASILVNGNDVPEGTVYVFGGKEYNYLMEMYVTI
ncbi:MAG: helix-turn-helix domain-containing protein [Mogibacterium sp.]|nr:helix-turn-helix domain-containing protein [Mogibacterium sp.]